MLSQSQMGGKRADAQAHLERWEDVVCMTDDDMDFVVRERLLDYVKQAC